MKPVIPEDKQYFTIGEVSRVVQVPAYVLRYWESRFGALRPGRRDSGRRKYTRKDIEVISQIRELLYDRRFTIDGANRHLRQAARRGPVQMAFELSDTLVAHEVLRDLKKDIGGLLKTLQNERYETKI